MTKKPGDAPKLTIVKKRRKRSTSIEAQIKRSAAKIYATGMAQAINAAVGQMLIQKLDEVLQLAAATGYRIEAGVPPTGVSPMQRFAPPPPSRPSVEHPCTTCGREGVYRTKPNQFNRTGSWYCRDHAAVGATADKDDQMDNALLGAQAPVIKAAPAIVQTAPAVIVPQVAEPIAPTPSDGLLAALGMAEPVE